MRLCHLWFVSLLALRTMALPLSPILSNVPVAATTNREVARGISSDGTNFLIVFQGDNLYPGVNVTNQLAAQRVSPDGTLLGSRIDLELNGSIPLVAFDGMNHLMVWTDSAGATPGVYGQRLDRTGAKIGGAFLVHSNAAVMEIGAIAFAFGQHFIVWSATNATNNAGLIAGQRVDSSGALIGSVLELGSAQSAVQQFPTLAIGQTNWLMTWTARRSDTNLWDVIGRFIDATGIASTEVIISQVPAGDAYRSAAAFGLTNYCVAWSREAGPAWPFTPGYSQPGAGKIFTNVLFPMLFGRLVDASGVMEQGELQLSRAAGGQIWPAVTFAKTNFFLAWNDCRFSYWNAYSQCSYQPPYSCTSFEGDVIYSYALFGRIMNADARPIDTEFILHAVDGSWPYFATGSAVGPACLAAGDSTFVLRNAVKSSAGGDGDVSLIALKRGPSDPPSVTVLGISNGAIRLHIEGRSGASYCLYAADTFTNWPSVTSWTNWNWISGPQQNVFMPPPVWPPAPMTNGWTVDVPMTTGTRFFRAVDGEEVCKSNLRKILWAKEQWALDARQPVGSTPILSVLYGPTNYVNPAPFCPNGGAYTVKILYQLPTCNIPGHAWP
jgi:hypothetical protein